MKDVDILNIAKNNAFFPCETSWNLRGARHGAQVILLWKRKQKKKRREYFEIYVAEKETKIGRCQM